MVLMGKDRTAVRMISQETTAVVQGRDGPGNDGKDGEEGEAWEMMRIIFRVWCLIGSWDGVKGKNQCESQILAQATS